MICRTQCIVLKSFERSSPRKHHKFIPASMKNIINCKFLARKAEDNV